MNSSLLREIGRALPLLLFFCSSRLDAREIRDANGGLLLLEVRWGRLVDVRDSSGAVVAREKVVEEGIQSDRLTYEVTRNPVTEVTTVKILPGRGTAAFESAFTALDDALGHVEAKTLTSPPPYSMVPRNAALLLRFNQKVSASSLSSQTVRVFQGVSASQELEVRLRVDPNDARNVIVDPAVSPIESEWTGLPANAFGLPAAATTAVPNVQVRIPTASGRQTTLLRGVTGSSPEDDDPSDGPDVVRAFRSGGSTAVTGDPHDGFLYGLASPSILGTQPVTICSAVPPSPNPNHPRQKVRFGFSLAGCAFTPELGDVLQQGAARGVVVKVFNAASNCPTAGPPVPTVRVELLTRGPGGNPIPFLAGSAEYVLPYEAEDEPKAGCFVTFEPPPLDPPAGGIDPLTVARVRFSEPMDPDSIHPFDTLTLTLSDPDPAGPAALPPSSFVVGDLSRSSDFREFTFVPLLPLPHVNGSGETRHLRVATGPDGVRSLGGGFLSVPKFSVPFTLRPDAPTASTAGFALRFNAVNETDATLGLPDPAGKPEYGGQVVFEPGELRGRAVARFSKAADWNHPFVGVGVAFGAPILTPLTSWGSRLQTLWRHDDLGLSGADPSEMNLDVERLAWAPFGGVVVADALPRFRIDLAHSTYFPDEYIDPGSLLPIFPLSGLDGTKFYPTVLPTAANPQGGLGNPFAFWHWDPSLNGGMGGVIASPPTTVHDGPYVINPLDLFLTGGVPPVAMLRFPPFTTTYTWRDTGYPFARKGGPNNLGVEPFQWNYVFPPPRPALYPTGQVPSICLPLLMQYRSYPPTGPQTSLNLNGLQITLMCNTSARPNFRVFSTGAPSIPVDPDLNLPAEADSGLYWGQADFVIRVTRAYTHWFDTGSPTSLGGPMFATPVIEPAGNEQPPGTSVVVEYRGGSSAADGLGPGNNCGSSPATCDPLNDASKANAYGIYIVGGGSAIFPPNQAVSTAIGGVQPPFVMGNATLAEWTPDIGSLNGKRYLQMRFTFLNNIVTGEVPSLSSVGVGYLK